MSFVPAAGVFTLMSYKAPAGAEGAPQWQPKYIKQNAWAQSQRLGGGARGSSATQVPLPLYIRPQATFGATRAE